MAATESTQGEVPQKDAATAKKYRPGFRGDGSAYPGVDPVTGERRTVTYNGLREEFGDAVGIRLYNLIASAGFGGVMRHRPALSLRTLRDENAVEGLSDERLKQRVSRRKTVMEYIQKAEEGKG